MERADYQNTYQGLPQEVEAYIISYLSIDDQRRVYDAITSHEDGKGLQGLLQESVGRRHNRYFASRYGDLTSKRVEPLSRKQLRQLGIHASLLSHLQTVTSSLKDENTRFKYMLEPLKAAVKALKDGGLFPAEVDENAVRGLYPHIVRAWQRFSEKQIRAIGMRGFLSQEAVEQALYAHFLYKDQPEDPDVVLAALSEQGGSNKGADGGFLALCRHHTEVVTGLAKRVFRGAPRAKDGDGSASLVRWEGIKPQSVTEAARRGILSLRDIDSAVDEIKRSDSSTADVKRQRKGVYEKWRTLLMILDKKENKGWKEFPITDLASIFNCGLIDEDDCKLAVDYMEQAGQKIDRFPWEPESQAKQGVEESRQYNKSPADYHFKF